MSEMVERAGEAALEQLQNRLGFAEILEKIRLQHPDNWSDIVDDVGRAAIKAMMEPTLKMRQYGHTASQTPTRCWQAMLTAALED